MLIYKIHQYTNSNEFHNSAARKIIWDGIYQVLVNNTILYTITAENLQKYVKLYNTLYQMKTIVFCTNWDVLSVITSKIEKNLTS